MTVGRDGIEVQWCVRGDGTCRDLTDGLDGPHLVVGHDHGQESDPADVLLEHPVEVFEVHRTVVEEIDPRDLRPLVLHEPLHRVDRRVVLPPAATTTGRSASAFRDQYSPLIARLIASVPPETKSASMPSTPRVAATASLASSRVRLAACPWLWIEDELPMVEATSTQAAAASGRNGVVAEWSR